MKHAKVVAKAVVVNKKSKEVLLLRRSETDVRRPLDWDLPGGVVEDDEDFAAAVAREIEEEAGLKVAREDLHLIWTLSTIDPTEIVCKMYYIGITDESDVHLSFEHDQFVWLNLEKAMETHNYPAHQKILKLVRDHQLLNG